MRIRRSRSALNRIIIALLAFISRAPALIGAPSATRCSAFARARLSSQRNCYYKPPGPITMHLACRASMPFTKEACSALSRSLSPSGRLGLIRIRRACRFRLGSDLGWTTIQPESLPGFRRDVRQGSGRHGRHRIKVSPRLSDQCLEAAAICR
jgi:hypothetical protein